jgi:hypothetical protein
METFPLDILLYIIDLLAGRDDIKSLQTLSQACKSMVPLCRKHLFSLVYLQSTNSERYNGLFSKNPDIASYVRNLYYGVYNHISLHELNILDILKKRSSLQSIVLSSQLPSSDWNLFPESMRSFLVSLIQLPTVAQLTISSFKNFPVTVLSGCSNLIDLKLSNIKFAPPEVNQVISRSKIPNLVSLYIDEQWASDVASYLNSASDGPIDFSRLQKAKVVVNSQRDIFKLIGLIKETTRLEFISIKTYLFSE